MSSEQKKSSRRGFLGAAASAVVAGVVAGVGGWFGGRAAAPAGEIKTVTETTTKTVTGTTTATPQLTPVTIGVTLPLTGALAADGELCKKGLDLAIEKANLENGVLGRPVKSIVYDDGYDISKIPSLYERLITEDKVDILLSPYCTYVAHPAYAVAYKHKKAMWVVCSIDLAEDKDAFYYLDSQIESGRPGGGWPDGMLRLFQEWDKWADPDSDYPNSIAMTMMATPYGEFLAKGWAPQWEAMGIKPVLIELTDVALMDYMPYIEKIKSLGADIYYQNSYFAQGCQARRQAYEAGLDKTTRFYLNESGAVPEWFVKPDKGGLTNEQSQNVISYGGKQWSEKYHGGWSDWFRPKWEGFSGSRKGSVYAGLGTFQTVEFAVKAVNQANSLDSDVLAEFVRHNVITTSLCDALLDERGANILQRYTAVQYIDGVPITLWPLDIAEAKPVYRSKR